METKPNDLVTTHPGARPNYPGLTKREYFASMAMQGICSNMDNPVLQSSPMNVAAESVQFADALIKQLNKQNEGSADENTK